MLDGGFSVQMTDHNTFGRIPVDQTIEETINRDTQTSGTHLCTAQYNCSVVLLTHSGTFWNT